MGEVEVQRGDGDASILHRFEVRPLGRMPGRLAAADPVVRSPAWVLPLDDSLGVNARAESGHTHAGERDREVDVQDDVRIAMRNERPSDELLRNLGATLKRESFADERGECDGRDAEQRTLK